MNPSVPVSLVSAATAAPARYDASSTVEVDRPTRSPRPARRARATEGSGRSWANWGPSAAGRPRRRRRPTRTISLGIASSERLSQLRRAPRRGSRTLSISWAVNPNSDTPRSNPASMRSLFGPRPGPRCRGARAFAGGAQRWVRAARRPRPRRAARKRPPRPWGASGARERRPTGAPSAAWRAAFGLVRLWVLAIEARVEESPLASSSGA